MKYELSLHAQDVIEERGIRDEWIKQVLDNPSLTEQDPLDDGLEHRLGRIEGYGNRVLRVIFNKEVKPVRIVTVYFDRKMKDKL